MRIHSSKKNLFQCSCGYLILSKKVWTYLLMGDKIFSIETHPTHLQLMPDWVTVSVQVEDQRLLFRDGAGVSGRTTHTLTVLHLHTFPYTEAWCEAHLKTYSQLFLTRSMHLAEKGISADNTCIMLCTWQVSMDLTICAFWQESIEPARLRITHTADSSMNSDTCGGTQSHVLIWSRVSKTRATEGWECAEFYSSKQRMWRR